MSKNTVFARCCGRNHPLDSRYCRREMQRDWLKVCLGDAAPQRVMSS